MKETNTFQLIVLAIFGICIVVGVAVFALVRSSSQVDRVAVTVWGTLNQATFGELLKATGLDKDESLSITYVEKRPETFDSEFVEALASGSGPDLIFLPHESILKHRNKIFPIPYESFSERTFKDTFIEGSEIYLSDAGVLALPFSVDPLVLYWNRLIFTNEGVAVPPRFWGEFFALSSRLTIKDASLNIERSAIPFGEFQNITNAKEVLSALIIQAGNPIVVREGETLHSVLSDNLGQPASPGQAAVNFYTEFSNPVKSFYTWNRSLPASQNFFLAGDLAMYIGFASEISALRNKNPNLNFDIAALPQEREAPQKATYGKFVGLAITNNSRQKAGAFKVASVLTGGTAIASYASVSGLPPVRRDLLANRPSDAFMPVLYDSALWARAWLSPDSAETGAIFKEMIESITSGRKPTSQAVQDASIRLQSLLSGQKI